MMKHYLLDSLPLYHDYATPNTPRFFILTPPYLTAYVPGYTTSNTFHNYGNNYITTHLYSLIKQGYANNVSSTRYWQKPLSDHTLMHTEQRRSSRAYALAALGVGVHFLLSGF